MTCEKHKTYVDYEGSLEELAWEVSDLRYDALYEFLQHLSLKIEKDGSADLERGRLKLSSELRNAANSIRNAWIICEPYMGHNRDNLPESKTEEKA